MTRTCQSAALWTALTLLCTPMAAQAADAERGATLYEQRCVACHSLDTSRIGPAHRGVVGRKAGGVPGFAYSPALKGSDLVWTEDSLDRWLADPQSVIPGQRMNYRVADAVARADIIAFLKRQSP